MIKSNAVQHDKEEATHVGTCAVRRDFAGCHEGYRQANAAEARAPAALAGSANTQVGRQRSRWQ